MLWTPTVTVIKRLWCNIRAKYFCLRIAKRQSPQYMTLTVSKNRIIGTTPVARRIWGFAYWETFVLWALLTSTTLWADSADNKLMIFFLIFPGNRIWQYNTNCLHWRQFAWNVKPCFLGKMEKSISICHLLKILPRVLRDNHDCHYYFNNLESVFSSELLAIY